jgi:hypothetical protein
MRNYIHDKLASGPILGAFLLSSYQVNTYVFDALPMINNEGNINNSINNSKMVLTAILIPSIVALILFISLLLLLICYCNKWCLFNNNKKLIKPQQTK